MSDFLPIPAVFLMTRNPIQGGDGGGEGDFAGEDDAGDDFGEFVYFVAAETANIFETFALGGEGGSAAVGGDDEGGDGYGKIEVVFGGEFDVDDAGGGFGDVGDVLAGGDEHGGDAVGGVEAVVVGPGEDGADVGDAGHVGQVFRFHPHLLNENVALDGAFGRDALASGSHDVDLGGFLVGGEVGFEKEVDNAGVVIEYPTTSGEGGSADHVLPGGVAGGVVEAQVGEFAGEIAVYVLEFGNTGGGFGLFFDMGEVFGGLYPLNEFPCGAGVGKDEDRRSLHGVAHNAALDTAG